jgi:hypothetical protein
VSVYVPAELRRRIRFHFRDRCAYCHTAESLTVAIFELEHIVPRSAGGDTVFENLCLSCPTCNRYKSDRRTVPSPDRELSVPLFHPHQEDWSDHFAWSADSTELVGRTDTGKATISALKMNRPQLIRVRRMWVAMGEHPPDP